jgi:hypothetical protein
MNPMDAPVMDHIEEASSNWRQTIQSLQNFSIEVRLISEIPASKHGLKGGVETA